MLESFDDDINRVFWTLAVRTKRTHKIHTEKLQYLSDLYGLNSKTCFAKLKTCTAQQRIK